MAGTAVTLRTLGEFRVAVGGVELVPPPTQKARALTAYLAMNRFRDVARERLMEAFWPGSEPCRARDSLNTAIHSVRRCFRDAGLAPGGFIDATRSVVRWSADADVDAESLTGLGDAPSAPAIERALAAYVGEFLEGCYDEWTVAQRERIADAHERALVAAVVDLRDVAAARALVALDPYAEPAYRLLFDAEIAAGRPLAARSIALRCARQLAELGLHVSASFEAAAGALLSGRASSGSASRSPSPRDRAPLRRQPCAAAWRRRATQSTGTAGGTAWAAASRAAR